MSRTLHTSSPIAPAYFALYLAAAVAVAAVATIAAVAVFVAVAADAAVAAAVFPEGPVVIIFVVPTAIRQTAQTKASTAPA